MNKTPEQLAEEFAELFAGERRKTIAKKSWWTGYQAAQQWNSVKEQNPEARKMVLVRHKTFGVQIGFIDDNHARPCRNRWIVYVREFEEDAGNHIPKTGKYEHIEVTHWMELPTAPKKEV